MDKMGTMEKLIQAYDNGHPTLRNILEMEFLGIAIGISAANQFGHILKDNEYLFCAPKGFKITGKKSFEIFRKYVKKKSMSHQSIDGVGIIVLTGFMEIYLCK